MTYERSLAEGLNYFPCRYGTSKLIFRGPKQKLDGDYIAFLGGTEMYGKFVEIPVPAIVELESGIRSVNLGCVNAGLDAYVGDKSILSVCRGARVTVLQILGAQNMSNRFYMVHPRRNDRFLRASGQMLDLFPDLEFINLNFTRHLLTTLEHEAPDNFAIVRSELKSAWSARMRRLIAQIETPVVLLWLARHSPDEAREHGLPLHDPWFVDRAMLDALRPAVAGIVEVVATEDEVTAGRDELVYDPLEEAAAREMLGPVVSRRAATALSDAIEGIG